MRSGFFHRPAPSEAPRQRTGNHVQPAGEPAHLRFLAARVSSIASSNTFSMRSSMVPAPWRHARA